MVYVDAVLVVVLAWFVSSLVKGVVSKERILDGTENGGMPSSHSATAVGLAAVFYLHEGASPVFLLALYLAIVVGTDAIRVRKTLEIQSHRVNRLLEANGEEPLDVVEGHTTAQVWAGAVLGVVVAVAVYAVPDAVL